MCLYVEDDEREFLRQGERTARVVHKCDECERTIEAGERYRFWVETVWSEGLKEWKMCAHCWATIALGSALTGCPQSWYWGEVHNHRDMDTGFVANVLLDEGHDLTAAQKIRMLRTVAGRRRQWRRHDGSLLPVPTPVEAA